MVPELNLVVHRSINIKIKKIIGATIVSRSVIVELILCKASLEFDRLRRVISILVKLCLVFPIQGLTGLINRSPVQLIESAAK